MMKRIIILFLVFFTGFCFSDVQINGKFNHDSVIVKTTNDFNYTGIAEFRLIMTRISDDWRFYSDIGLTSYLGNAAVLPFPGLFDVKSLFIKYDSGIGQFIIGRAYINLGLPALFNPFELNKNIRFSELSYEKTGIDGLSYDLGFGELSGIRLFFIPDKDASLISAGGDIRIHSTFIDMGFVVSRKNVNNHTIGTYFQTDLILDLKSACAIHFDESLNSKGSEISLNLDYSLFANTVVINSAFYYAEKGATKLSDYIVLHEDDRYMTARYYLYIGSVFQPDEFMSVNLDSFVNIIDSSSLLVPSFTYLLSNGLTASLYVPFVFGFANEEFSTKKYGIFSVDLRLVAKL